MKTKYLIDTNILIYHTAGSKKSIDFLSAAMEQESFYISVITKIEFLGWDKHTPEGLKKCKELIEQAIIFPVDQDVADKAIEIKRGRKIKIADAVIAATALLNNLKLATRNVDDFTMIAGVEVVNPFE